MRKLTHVMAAVAGVSLLAAGCAAGSGSPDETPAGIPGGRGDADLLLWVGDTQADAARALADAFAEENGITVTVQPVADRGSIFVTANQAGNGPDVVMLGHDAIGVLAQNGAIDPIPVSPDQLSGFSDIAVDSLTAEGQLWGMPWGVETVALFCNKEIVGETTFETLDDVIAAGQAAEDAGTVSVALSLPVGTNGDAYHMHPLYTSMGGYMFGRDDAGNYDPNDLGIGEPGSLAAAQKIHELGQAGENVLRQSVSTDNSISLFTEGQAACMISGPWALADVRTGLGEAGYTLQSVPGFAGQGPAKPFMGTQAFYVASNAQNKTFAQAFVQGLNDVAAQTTLYQLGNLPPAMISVREAAAAEDPDAATFSEAAEGADPMPTLPEMSSVWSPLGQAYAAIVGGSDPEGAMTTAGNTIRQVIAGS